MDWREAIWRWRALPDEEKHRRRWESIPRSVARSFAIAGEPVDLALLEAEHARQPMPPMVRALGLAGASGGPPDGHDTSLGGG